MRPHFLPLPDGVIFPIRNPLPVPPLAGPSSFHASAGPSDTTTGLIAFLCGNKPSSLPVDGPRSKAYIIV